VGPARLCKCLRSEWDKEIEGITSKRGAACRGAGCFREKAQAASKHCATHCDIIMLTDLATCFHSFSGAVRKCTQKRAQCRQLMARVQQSNLVSVFNSFAIAALGQWKQGGWHAYSELFKCGKMRWNNRTRYTCVNRSLADNKSSLKLRTKDACGWMSVWSVLVEKFVECESIQFINTAEK